jgi:hypothetical protein
VSKRRERKSKPDATPTGERTPVLNLLGHASNLLAHTYELSQNGGEVSVQLVGKMLQGDSAVGRR